MNVRCINVNYFSRGQSAPNGEVVQVPAATVSFSYVDAQAPTNKIENFTLTFTDLNGPLDYFPNTDYVLTITPTVVD